MLISFIRDGLLVHNLDASQFYIKFHPDLIHNICEHMQLCLICKVHSNNEHKIEACMHAYNIDGSCRSINGDTDTCNDCIYIGSVLARRLFIVCGVEFKNIPREQKITNIKSRRYACIDLLFHSHTHTHTYFFLFGRHVCSHFHGPWRSFICTLSLFAWIL